MSFQSLGFLVFLALAVGVCRLWGGRTARRGAARFTAANAAPLALFSLFFYWRGCGSLRELLPIGAGMLVTWWAARRLRSGGSGPVFALAAVWHIAVLLAYKYTAFFTAGRFDLGPAPLGLSFFTFQQLWLLKEAYAGDFTLE